MKKKRILLRKAAEQGQDALDAFRECGLHPLLQKIYLNRGLTNNQELSRELSRLPSPDLFKGMTTATEILTEALHAGHKITVVGDFDADGATSSALAIHALRAMGFNIDYLVPNRFDYGYGLTPEIVEVAISTQQPNLIITVDNGISSWNGVSHARKNNIRVIITDHHLPGKTLPDADAIVNPNQPNCQFPCKSLAGVGVIFYVISALRKKLRELNYFEENNIPEPVMADYLDLVALGTVADVVSLDFYNRILVQQGLMRIRAGRTRPGILALLEIARRNPARLVSDDFAFAVAPRLNAAGRMDDISTGIQCLLSNDIDEARLLGQELDDLNRDRKSVEKNMQDEALQHVENLSLDESSLPWGLCVYDESWHQGVVGLLASRLKERFHRPVIAFAPADDSSTLKGSARSIEGLHIRDALDAIASQHPGLIEKFGGHAMAAGLSLPTNNLEKFKQAFNQETKRQLSEEQLQAVVLSDGELSSEYLQLNIARMLRDAGPWGQHFPTPLFHGDFRVKHKRLMGDQHIKLVLEQISSETNTSEPRASKTLVDAVAFFVEEVLREQIEVDRDITLAYRLDVNEYRGEENLQLIADYVEVQLP